MSNFVGYIVSINIGNKVNSNVGLYVYIFEKPRVLKSVISIVKDIVGTCVSKNVFLIVLDMIGFKESIKVGIIVFETVGSIVFGFVGFIVYH